MQDGFLAWEANDTVCCGAQDLRFSMLYTAMPQ